MTSPILQITSSPIRFVTTFWRALGPLTRRLLVFGLLNPVLVTVLLLFGTPRGTLLQYLAQFVAFGPENFDSWDPMIRALEYLRTDHTRAVYEEIFFARRIKFQYPLTSLLFLYPFEAALKLLANTGLSLMDLLDAASWAAVVVTIGASIQIFNLALLHRGGGTSMPRSAADAFIRYLTLTGLGLTFYPLLKGYSLGQIQTWVSACFALMLWAWMAGRQSAAGILSGVMILVKPQYGLLLLWGLIGRRGRFAAACGATVGAGAIISLALFGWAENLDYWSVLSFIARHGEAYYANHSINGLLNRYLGNGFNLRFDTNGFAPFHPVVYIATMATTLMVSALALATARRAPAPPDPVGPAFVVLSATLASPIAWEHHYGVLLPIFAALVARFWDGTERRRAALLVLAASYVLASNYFGIARRFARAGPEWTLLQSYLLVAGVTVWTLLFREGRRSRMKTPIPQL